MNDLHLMRCLLDLLRVVGVERSDLVLADEELHGDDRVVCRFPHERNEVSDAEGDVEDEESNSLSGDPAAELLAAHDQVVCPEQVAEVVGLLA